MTPSKRRTLMEKPDRFQYTRRGFIGAAAMLAGGAFAGTGEAGEQAGTVSAAPSSTTVEKPTWDGAEARSTFFLELTACGTRSRCGPACGFSGVVRIRS